MQTGVEYLLQSVEYTA